MNNDMNKQTTIYDISQIAGVSIATVSRVLNDSTKVSEKTKERVLAVIKELNYEPNVFARSLGTGSMKTIGIMCDDVSDIYMANAVSTLERELRQNGFNAVLDCTGSQYDNKKRSLKAMENRKVDAVIMVGSHYEEQCVKKNNYIEEFAKHIPVMMINGVLKHENIYCNLSDEFEGFYEATEYLIRTGCRKIVFLYRNQTASVGKKCDGYRKALYDFGIPFDETLVVHSTKRMQFIKEDLRLCYEVHPDIDAIIACDDELGIGAVKFAQDMDLSIPDQVSIIGCNNSVLSICSTPEMSSIDNEGEALCINTVNQLMSVLEGGEAPRKTTIGGRLVLRGTTRKLNDR